MTVGERKLRERILVLVGTLARDNCAPEIRTSRPRFSSRSGFICPPRLNIDALSIAGAELPQRTTTGSASSLRSKSFLRLWSVDQRQLSPVYQPVGTRQNLRWRGAEILKNHFAMFAELRSD